jgi:CheY-like chemotaxis protein
MEYKGRILAMDDNETLRGIIAEMLTVLGFRVLCVESGELAYKEYVDAMASHPFDLVILDLIVPGGMGGRECLERIKAIDPNVIAIVSSGQYGDEALLDAASCGFKGQIDKPFTIEQMEEVVSKAMGAMKTGV